MGRGRKSQYVSKLTSKDKAMLKGFANAGYLNLNQLKQNFNMADRRVAGFERDGYIQKVMYLDKGTKNSAYAFKLTDKGKALCKSYLGTQSFYRSSSPLHDQALADKYTALSAQERETWGTENQARDLFMEKLEQLQEQDQDRYQEIMDKWQQGQISPVDGFYTNSQGIVVAVEVVTNSYGIAEIEAKEEFCTIMGMEYNQINA